MTSPTTKTLRSDIDICELGFRHAYFATGSVDQILDTLAREFHSARVTTTKSYYRQIGTKVTVTAFTHEFEIQSLPNVSWSRIGSSRADTNGELGPFQPDAMAPYSLINQSLKALGLA